MSKEQNSKLQYLYNKMNIHVHFKNTILSNNSNNTKYLDTSILAWHEHLFYNDTVGLNMLNESWTLDNEFYDTKV